MEGWKVIRYEEAELISVLPPVLSNNPDNAAISYAYKMAMQKIILLSIRTSLYANIDKMDEEVLDLMALEFRAQYYDEGLPLEVKRKLIKNALAWYQRAGTKSAVNELIQTVFGEGEVVEWFDFTDPPFTPGMFEIATNSRVTEELINYFSNLIHRVKNARSHIRRITIIRTIGMEERVASGVITKPQRTVYNSRSKEKSSANKHSIGAGMICIPEVTILNDTLSKEYTVGMENKAFSGVVTEPQIYIYN